MQKVFNNFLCSDLFDKLPLFLKKNFVKLATLIFVLQTKINFPKKNYTAKFSGKYHNL